MGVPDVVLVQIAGKIVRAPECQQIEWLIASLLSEGEKKTIFDVSRVCRLDSTGVGILVRCHGKVKVKEAVEELRVAGAEGQNQNRFRGQRGASDAIADPSLQATLCTSYKYLFGPSEDSCPLWRIPALVGRWSLPELRQVANDQKRLTPAAKRY